MGHLSFLPALAVMLIAAKASGALSLRFKLPAVFGELLAGLVLGPAILGWVIPSTSLQDLSELGVIVLMFLAGLETDLLEVKAVGKAAFVAALGGVVLPFGAGFWLAQAFHFGLVESLFTGAILTATSVSISAQTLREMGHLESRVGQTILAAAVIDDVLGVIVLTLVSGMSQNGDMLWPLAKMALFFSAALIFGRYAIPLFANRIHRHLSPDAGLAVVLALVLAASWAAEELGSVAAITGAYLAGFAVGQTHLRNSTVASISNLGFGFLVPLFFVGVGMVVRPQDLAEAPFFATALTAVAVITKVAGCFVGARIGGMRTVSSWRVGLGMVSRGEVALVIAAVGLANGVVDLTLYSTTVVMALATTLLAPLLIRVGYAGSRAEEDDERGEAVLRAEDGSPVLALLAQGGQASDGFAGDGSTVSPLRSSEVGAGLGSSARDRDVEDIDDTVLRWGRLTLDPGRHEVKASAVLVDVTYTEFHLLAFLMERADRVATREAVFKAVWGSEFYGGLRSVDVHIRRLRSKLEAHDCPYIATVPNVGYRLVIPQQEEWVE